MGDGAARHRTPAKMRPLAVLPTTRLGWRAVWLAVASLMLVMAWSVMGPAGALPDLACGLVGGVVGLIAILRRGERAVTVFAALLPLLFVLFFVIGSTVGSL